MFIVRYALLGHYHQNYDYQNGYHGHGYGGNNYNDHGGKIEWKLLFSCLFWIDHLNPT